MAASLLTLIPHRVKLARGHRNHTAARTRPSIQTLQTLTQHAALISAAMTCVTALIWIIYVSFFLRSYRRQQLPPILIT